jgi:hypothetical protein
MNRSVSPTSAPLTTALVHPAVQKALGVLLDGYEYAQDLQTSPWEFAVEITALLAAGCTPNTLHWLVRRGYVEHAVVNAEGAPAGGQGDAKRGFQEGTCFVLTELGASVAHSAGSPASPDDTTAPVRLGRASAEREVPVWDSTHGELRFQGCLVRRFRNAGSDQRAVLDAFQNRGWPQWLQDPLPRPESVRLNPKRRLHDTIKNLNRGHEARCLHFYSADAGRAVGWEWQA